MIKLGVIEPSDSEWSSAQHNTVYSTIRHFRHNMEGREFFVNTDHKPYVMNSTTERPFLRQTRHLASIAEFTINIQYVKGETNFVADALSRPPYQLSNVMR